MGHLLDELRDLSRIGRVKNDPVEIPLQEIIQEALILVAGRIAEKNVQIQVTKEPVMLWGDRSRLLEVFQNLIDNAVKFMGAQAAPRVEIGVEKSGGEIVLFVRDNGIGVDPRHQKKIFDLFEKLDRQAEGTGIGLALVKRIVEVHGGMITVYSEIGHGATFNIYLPLSDRDAHRQAPVEAGLIKGSATILLVDDEEMILDVGQSMLESLGYRVVVSRGGQEAVKAITDMGNEIDLVILDMIMPGMDGGRTFDLIREIQPGMLVLLSSGYAINGQANEIIARGCNGFIQKPYNLSELSNKVRNMLDVTNKRINYG
jgi:two-component system, cell cycle sensor histidine kinase and response regulator CckA